MITRALVLLRDGNSLCELQQIERRLALCVPREIVRQAVQIRQLSEPTEEALDAALQWVENLLGHEALRQSPHVYRDTILLLYLVKLEDAASLFWARDWSERLMPYLQQALQPLPPDLRFLPLLVAALCERASTYAAHYAWLREVTAARCFEQIYLLTPTNRDPQLNPEGVEQLRPEEVAHLATETVMALVSTDILDRVQQVVHGTVPPPMLCSAGAGSILFPADALIQQRSSQFGAALLEHYLQNPAQITEQHIDQFVSNNTLTHEAVCQQLTQINQAGETVINRLKFPGFIFKQVPIDSLPERIASYGDYLARERVRELIAIIDRNTQRIIEQGVHQLHEQVDALVAHPQFLSPSGALEFLRRLWYRLREERQFACAYCSEAQLEQRYRQYVEAEATTELPSEQECHDRLVEALRNRPTLFASLGRYGLLGLVVAYGVEVMIRLMGDAGWLSVLGMLKDPWLWFSIVWGLFLLAGILTVHQAYRLILRRAVDYQNAVLRRLRRLVYQHLTESIDRCYTHLLDEIGDPEEQPPPAGSERRRVHDWQDRVKALVEQMQNAPLDFPENPFCLPVSRFRELPAFPYKQSESVDRENELRQCAQQNVFACWRQVVHSPPAEDSAVSALQHGIETYVSQGFEYMRSQYSVLQLLTDGADIDQLKQQLMKLLHARSFFYLPMDAPLPHMPVQIVCYAAEDQSYAQPLFCSLQSLHHSMNNDRTRLTYCQVMWGIQPAHSDFLRRWREDYGRYPDKAELHTVSEWQNLPDPATVENDATPIETMPSAGEPPL